MMCISRLAVWHHRSSSHSIALAASGPTVDALLSEGFYQGGAYLALLEPVASMGRRCRRPPFQCGEAVNAAARAPVHWHHPECNRAPRQGGSTACRRTLIQCWLTPSDLTCRFCTLRVERPMLQPPASYSRMHRGRRAAPTAAETASVAGFLRLLGSSAQRWGCADILREFVRGCALCRCMAYKYSSAELQLTPRFDAAGLQHAVAR